MKIPTAPKLSEARRRQRGIRAFGAIVALLAIGLFAGHGWVHHDRHAGDDDHQSKLCVICHSGAHFALDEVDADIGVAAFSRLYVAPKPLELPARETPPQRPRGPPVFS